MQLALSRWFAGKSQKPVRRKERASWTLTRLEDRTVPALTDPAVAVGAGSGHEPFVNIYDGSGNLLVTFNAYDTTFLDGVNTVLADINNDGVMDRVITGAGQGGAPHVKIFDIGALTAAASPTTHLVTDPRPLSEFMAYDVLFRGGVNVGTGDVDGDGAADIITGAGPTGGPHVKVFSGADGGQTLLESFFPYDTAFQGGVRVAGADLGGDNGGDPGSHKGTAEIITTPGPGGSANVRMWRHITGDLTPSNIGNLSGDQVFPGFFGGTFVTGGFFTHNHSGPEPGSNPPAEDFVFADIAVSADFGGGPQVRIFRLDTVDPTTNQFIFVPANNIVPGDAVGADPDANYQAQYPLTSFFPYSVNFRGGARVALVYDLNGDGRDELATAPGPTGSSEIRVISGHAASENDSLLHFQAFPVNDGTGASFG